jgi:hypothetical protein
MLLSLKLLQCLLHKKLLFPILAHVSVWIHHITATLRHAVAIVIPAAGHGPEDGIALVVLEIQRLKNALGANAGITLLSNVRNKMPKPGML